MTDRTALPRLHYTITVPPQGELARHVLHLADRYGWPLLEMQERITLYVETSPVATHLLLTDLLERAGDDAIELHRQPAVIAPRDAMTHAAWHQVPELELPA